MPDNKQETMQNKTELTFQAHNNTVQKVEISVISETDGLRHYQHKSSESRHCQRVNDKTYQEYPELPKVRTGNVAFDGLFALALWEMKLNSVSSITDAQYNQGSPIDCEGFKTGKEWDFIWTRDVSYAATLSLALLDPQRVKNSLIYKTSGLRTHVENSLVDREDARAFEIVQDTGSGGSWPISTDRVCWAFAAEAVSDNLSGDEKREFEEFVFHVLHNTVEADRKGCYQNDIGLYGGEQSFLDWREQSYPAWIPDNLQYMATCCSLSTNVCHYKALSLAATLANQCDEIALAEKYQAWADMLKTRINELFWHEHSGMYVSLLYGQSFHTAIAKFDWLGLCLVILTDIAPADRATRVLNNYPHSLIGPPVIFPMQPNIPIYHNRAIWPFVTGFGLLAGKKGHHIGIIDSAVDSLIRCAATCVSNMENMEWLTGKPFVEDKQEKDLSGPVINSEYQLWSVAAYLEMVIGSIFGVQIKNNKLSIKPVITRSIYKGWLNQQDSIELENLHWKNHRLKVKLVFDIDSREGDIFQCKAMLLNGEKTDNPITEEQLSGDNSIELQLCIADSEISARTRFVSQHPADATAFFAPIEPDLAVIRVAENQAKLLIKDDANQHISYQVYRNGKLLYSDLQQQELLDEFTKGSNPCYFVTATCLSSGNVSQPSVEKFVLPAINLYLSDLHYTCNKTPIQIEQQMVLKNWGAPQDSFEAILKIASAGTYRLQILYRNTANEIDTGITCGVKWLTLRDQDSQIVTQHIIQMPHTHLDKKSASLSTLVTADLNEGIYYLSMNDFMNMSYLAVNADYNGISGAGGTSGPQNTIDIHGIQLRVLQQKG